MRSIILFLAILGLLAVATAALVEPPAIKMPGT